jgi:hypothetical protein
MTSALRREQWIKCDPANPKLIIALMHPSQRMDPEEAKMRIAHMKHLWAFFNKDYDLVQPGRKSGTEFGWTKSSDFGKGWISISMINTFAIRSLFDPRATEAERAMAKLNIATTVSLSGESRGRDSSWSSG